VSEPLDALEVEASRTGAFLHDLTPADWARATRCPPMTVRELAVHALRGAYRVTEFLGGPSIDDEPELDVVTYYRYDPAEVAPAVVSRAKSESDARPADADIAAEWGEAWAAAIESARREAADDPVIASPFGTIRLREYVKSRCVEVTIHTMDLRDALGLEPDPTPEGIDATCDALRGLLGTDLRPLGMDEVRFSLLGTGRATMTGAEREMLGPLSDSFPLLQ